MHTRFWLWRASSTLPGEVLCWTQTHEPDQRVQGRAVAEYIRTRPAGKRGILLNELFDGETPETRHLWGRPTNKPKLTKGEVTYIMRQGFRRGTLEAAIAAMTEFWDGYIEAGGPLLDMIVTNVERKGNRWNKNFGHEDPRGAGATWEEMREWAGYPATMPERDFVIALEQRAARNLADALRLAVVEPYRARFPDQHTRFVNSPDIYCEPGAVIHGDWPVYSTPFCDEAVSCPQLYLGGPDPVTGYRWDMATWTALSDGSRAIPCFGDVAMNGTRGPEYRPAWKGLVEDICGDGVVDALLWWHGPIEAGDERFMADVMRPLAGGAN